VLRCLRVGAAHNRSTTPQGSKGIPRLLSLYLASRDAGGQIAEDNRLGTGLRGTCRESTARKVSLALLDAPIRHHLLNQPGGLDKAGTSRRTPRAASYEGAEAQTLPRDPPTRPRQAPCRRQDPPSLLDGGSGCQRDRRVPPEDVPRRFQPLGAEEQHRLRGTGGIPLADIEIEPERR